MIDPIDLITAIKKLDIRLVTGVPDSLLADACACITLNLAPENHVIATNEGAAVGLAIGHYLATNRPALVYMQNAGLGNIINPIASLVDPQVYGIPMVLMVGWRGEMLPDGKQAHDEPQHVKQGQITLAQLHILDIPFRVIDAATTNLEELLNDLVEFSIMRSGPVALVVRKQTFSAFKLPIPPFNPTEVTREEAISAIIQSLPANAIIVSTTGKASRELFELRKQFGMGHQKDFLTVGGMGHAGQIAAGIAMAKPDTKVVCIDGDGAILMHMGSLAISAECPNLLHIVINNRAHDSVGGQPTKGTKLDFSRIAAICGYQYTAQIVTAEDIKNNIGSWLSNSGSTFLEIKCKQGARPDLGRPDRTPTENKHDFMQFIQSAKKQ